MKAILLDFDGVIAESLDAKTKAIRELFREFPGHLKKIEQFHLLNGGMSRFEKFRRIYNDILEIPLSEDYFNKLLVSFSSLVVQSVINAPYVKGAKDFLDYFFNKVLLFVVSGTPEDEIRYIVRKRGLSLYFNGVFGSPRSKEKIIEEIIRSHDVPGEQSVFIGDAVNDYNAALATGVRFIARVTGVNQPWLNQKGIEKLCNDLKEALDYLMFSDDRG